MGTDDGECVTERAGTLRWSGTALEVCDGTEWGALGSDSTGGGGGTCIPGTQQYTSSGGYTFTMPDGCTHATITVVGGGGQGGSNGHNGRAGGGGGGGAARGTYSIGAATELAVVVAATSGLNTGTYSDGNGGNESSVTDGGGKFIYATGGAGGKHSGGGGGVGGQGYGGTLFNLAGGKGHDGQTYYGGGGGGAAGGGEGGKNYNGNDYGEAGQTVSGQGLDPGLGHSVHSGFISGAAGGGGGYGDAVAGPGQNGEPDRPSVGLPTPPSGGNGGQYGGGGGGGAHGIGGQGASGYVRIEYFEQ